MHAAASLQTKRLRIVPTTLGLVTLELASYRELGRALGVDVPQGWPPGLYDRDAMAFFRQRLNVDPADAGWYGWYVVYERTLVASIGFFGPPSEGVAEIGYSVVPSFRGQGIASESVAALVAYGFERGLRALVAHAALDNLPSHRVLERCGFVRVG